MHLNVKVLAVANSFILARSVRVVEKSIAIYSLHEMSQNISKIGFHDSLISFALAVLHYEV